MNTKRILLIIGGGIAAYKCHDLVRRLKERGSSVRVVLTAGGERFVTPLSLTALSGEAVFTNLFDAKDEAEIGHIELSREADLIVVAPATADLMARMAHGMANDLASAVLLATDKPVLIAPAMNVRMWEHAATRRNLDQLRSDGVHVVGPDKGDMACGEFGCGRMSEVIDIIAAIDATLSLGADLPLSGKTVLVTAGPTHEPIDPVRYIANRSSGKQGYEIAAAAARLGADTILVSGPTELKDPIGVRIVRVETAEEMLGAVNINLPVDVAICTAAVADWRVATQAPEKIKKVKSGQLPKLQLLENLDILRSLSMAGKTRPQLVVGFAAETEAVVKNATAKLVSKGCDWIIANDVSSDSGVMGGERNRVHVISAAGVEDWPEMSKAAVAEKLMTRIADALDELRAAAE